ncbi:alpha-1,2-fucosyltransferase [Priestia aryabhattai]|uniref:alpha-1,2-fucosyltransferase n=1 Tax=Priestia aryabhattai TaxID=412384 RepID=UPI003A8012F9
MRIVRIKSGLGNQMFQYAFYLNLKSLYKDTLADISTISKKNDHNGYELLDVFGVKLDVASEEQVEYYADDRMNLIDKVRRKTFGYKKTHYKEIEGLYDNKVWQKENALFDGYWQNEKYFLNVRDRVISTFTFKKELSQKNAILARKISESTSVSIHIRRGDYQKKRKYKEVWFDLYCRLL